MEVNCTESEPSLQLVFHGFCTPLIHVGGEGDKREKEREGREGKEEGKRWRGREGIKEGERERKGG